MRLIIRLCPKIIQQTFKHPDDFGIEEVKSMNMRRHSRVATFMFQAMMGKLPGS